MENKFNFLFSPQYKHADLEPSEIINKIGGKLNCYDGPSLNCLYQLLVSSPPHFILQTKSMKIQSK